MKQFAEKYYIVLILIVLGFGIQWKYLNEFPSHIHAWAQSDRYALAIGFNKNGFDFFHPQTYVLNHQFPAKSKQADKTVITAVDFPIHDYMAGIFMNLFESNSPWCFRLYILVYSLIGLFFLFRLSDLLTGDKLKSAFVVIFAATSPVFVYYQAGFLPTIPSLANGLIGLYLYFHYLKTESRKSFFLGLLFMTLAALSRLPFALLLIAITVYETFRVITRKKFDTMKFTGIVLSVLAIGGYFLYNIHLRNKYGSIFLNYALPPDNFTEFILILKNVYKTWFFEYFSLAHYIVFGLLLILSVVSTIVFKINPERPDKQPFILFILLLAGSVAYSLLMIQQFTAHDYYFLDTFYLPFILLLILVLKYQPRMNKVLRYLFIAVLGAGCIFFIVNGVKSQETRRQTGFWDRTEATVNNFRDSKRFLDSIKVPSYARILVLDAYAPNIPFIRMDRTGYAVLTTSRKNIEASLKWSYDYIVIQDAFFLSDIYSSDPGIINKIDKVAGNGKITVYKPANGTRTRNLYDFLGLTGKKPVYSQEVTFEPGVATTWQNVRPARDFVHYGQNSGFLKKDDEYGITLRITDPSMMLNRSRLLFFRGFFLKEQPVVDCQIAVSFTSGGKSLYYNSYDLKDFIRFYKTWHEVDLFFQLPEIEKKQGELSVYIWNKGRNEVFYDDVAVSIY